MHTATKYYGKIHPIWHLHSIKSLQKLSLYQLRTCSYNIIIHNTGSCLWWSNPLHPLIGALIHREKCILPLSPTRYYLHLCSKGVCIQEQTTTTGHHFLLNTDCTPAHTNPWEYLHAFFAHQNLSTADADLCSFQGALNAGHSHWVGGLSVVKISCIKRQYHCFALGKRPPPTLQLLEKKQKLVPGFLMLFVCMED